MFTPPIREGGAYMQRCLRYKQLMYDILIYYLYNKVLEFNVSMTCEGCSNAVNRVLGRLDGQFKMVDGLV